MGLMMEMGPKDKLGKIKFWPANLGRKMATQVHTCLVCPRRGRAAQNGACLARPARARIGC